MLIEMSTVICIERYIYLHASELSPCSLKAALLGKGLCQKYFKLGGMSQGFACSGKDDG